MKQLRPEGITFADVWHSPAMPFDETDYRLLGALPDDVDGYLDNLVTERNETACRELQVGDLSPDTSMLLNDDIYAIMLKYSMTKHARDTAPDCRTRLFSETLGIEVGVKSADAGYALADSLIPDKDFTDDRLSHLRQLEGVDPTSRIPHVLAKELHNAGLELHFSSEEEQAFVSLPASYVAVRLKEGLDPAVLPSDKLVDIVTNYGRNATANAASFHDSYTWLANCFGQHLVEEATVPIDDKLPTVILRRLGLVGIRHYDYLAEVLSDDPIEPDLTPNADIANAFIDVDLRDLYASVTNMSPWKHALVMYHEFTHASGALTWRVVDPAANDGRSLQWASGQTRFVVDLKSRQYGGLGNNEALTESEARQAFTRINPPPQPKMYQAEVDTLNKLKASDPGLVQRATEIYYNGTPNDDDIELLVAFDRTFKDEAAHTTGQNGSYSNLL